MLGHVRYDISILRFAFVVHVLRGACAAAPGNKQKRMLD
jgi:hypothetical protein